MQHNHTWLPDNGEILSGKFDAKLWNVLKLLFQNISQNII